MNTSTGHTDYHENLHTKSVKMAIADDEAELELVEEELESVEQELVVLLMRQSHLQERRRALQQVLALSDGGDDEPMQDWKAAFPWTSRVQELLREEVCIARTHVYHCAD